MKNASRDGNFVPTIQGVSSVDETTPQDIFVDPDTGEVLVRAGDSLPTTGNNPSDTYTEVVVGDTTTTTQQRVVGAVTYEKIFVENSATGVTTISAWEEV